MKLSQVLSSIKTKTSRVGQFLFMYNRMIYFVLFVCVLIGAVFGLNLALNRPSDEAYRAKRVNETQTSRFDTATIEKVKNLNAKQQTITDSPPAGQRTNPFGE